MGCIPTKALVRAAEIAHGAHIGAEFGIDVTARVDGVRVMDRVRRIIEHGNRFYETAIADDPGLGLVRGRARFTADGLVADMAEGAHPLPDAPVVIATGARPVRPPIPGLADVQAVTSDEVLRWRDLPASLIVIGAGAIGAELAQALGRLGVAVTWVMRGPRPLRGDGAEAGETILRVASAEGVRVVTGAHDMRVEPCRSGVRVQWEGGEAEAAHLLLAAGREPNLEGLDAEAGGVELDRGGIRVDAQGRTTRARTWAIGDAVGGAHLAYQFTHVATWEGPLVAENCIAGREHVMDHAAMPRVTFTDPEVASVGLNEATALERGHDPLVHVKLVREIGKARALGVTEGLVKIVLDRATGHLLGATIVAPHAGDMLPELTMPLHDGGDLRTLLATVHPHPTLSEAVKVAVREAVARIG